MPRINLKFPQKSKKLPRKKPAQNQGIFTQKRKFTQYMQSSIVNTIIIWMRRHAECLQWLQQLNYWEYLGARFWKINPSAK